MIGIYKVTSPKGKIYIGQSKNVEKRFRYYKSLHCKNQIALYRSFVKHGFENHSFEVIEECDVDLLNERERYWQEYYNVLNKGLNCLLTSTTEKNKIYSKSTIDKMSKSLKGRIITEEWRNNLSKAGTGRVFTKETRQKLTIANTGRFYSEETKKKIANNNPTSRIIIDMNTGVFYYSIAELAIYLNVNPSTLFDRLTERKTYKNKSQYKLV